MTAVRILFVISLLFMIPAGPAAVEAGTTAKADTIAPGDVEGGARIAGLVFTAVEIDSMLEELGYSLESYMKMRDVPLANAIPPAFLFDPVPVGFTPPPVEEGLGLEPTERTELPERFEEKWGYAVTDHLPSLFVPTGDFQKVRHHYWRTVLDMFLVGYFENVDRWCREHGVKFSGHLMGEDTLNAQIGWAGAAMPCYEYMQLPGIDHLTGSMQWPSGKDFLLTPLQCSSASHQLGRKEILAEMYGVSTQNLVMFSERSLMFSARMVSP